MTRWRRRARTVLGALVVACAGSAVAVAAPPPVTTSAPCMYPATAVADRWTPFAHPAEAKAPVSVQQLDQDPCLVLTADAAGRRWRSTNAGAQWTELRDGPPITRLLAERMQPRAGETAVGPLLASGPAQDGGSALPQVYVSDDEGVTFTPVSLSVTLGVTTPLGPVERIVPLQMSVAGATTAVHYDHGNPLPYVYLTGHAETLALPDLPVEVAVASLLKSTDGGHTFRPVEGARELTPTVVTVNPTSQEEIWVNDPQPGGRAGGGAWVSYDGGGTFNSVCCPNTAVHDIAVGAMYDGTIVVTLATGDGVLRSVDDGASWASMTTTPATSVRLPADAPWVALVTAGDGVMMGYGSDFTLMPGSPGCAPRSLRRDDVIAGTFLVDCADGSATYRLLLTRYGGGLDWKPPPINIPEVDPLGLNGRPLVELAVWDLPESNTATGTIAFDGSVLYYDRNTPGDIGRVRSSDGAFLGVWHTDYSIVSLTVDLRRNALLVTSATGELVAIDIATGRRHVLGQPPTKVATYDSLTDGLSWIPEIYTTLWRRKMVGDGPGDQVCSYTTPPNGNSSSTFVASGDGGGYVQLEDDSSILRIDRTCQVTGIYKHRRFSESVAENDAMACDTQSYFPQPSIWIRDSAPGTVTSYGVPFGYCPMPSRLVLELPREVYAASSTSLCAVLTNATTGRPATHRGVAVEVSGQVIGHGQTDQSGRVCVPYLPGGGFGGRRTLPVAARFAGDSALYPAHREGTITVLDSMPVPPPPVPQPPVVPPPPAYAPAVPPNPIPNPGPAPGQAPAPQAAQANAGQAQAQSQPVAQGVVVPQRQQQPQLALARAAQQIGLEENPMVAPARRRPLPVDPPAVAVVLGMCCAATVCGARALATARNRRMPR